MRALIRWAGVLIVPALAVTASLVAFQNPASHLSTVTAAVINDDQPVERNGQTIPLGRELAAKLVAHTGDNYSWVLTDARDAEAGLDSGKYRVAVKIPKNFSRAAISTGNDNPSTAEQARVDVTASPSSTGIDPLVSRTLTQAAVAVLNHTVVETYLDNVYLGFNKMHEQIGKAADGAGKVSDGAGKLADGNHRLVVGLGQLAAGSDLLAGGTSKLSAGASTLAGGAADLHDGAARLATGNAKLATGAGRLARGADQMAGGTGQLADGLTKLRNGTAGLPAQTRRLADGAQQVADGNRELADTVTPIANLVVAGIDKLPDLTTAAKQARQLADKCETPADLCAELQTVADRLVEASRAGENAKADVRAKAIKLRDGINDLADGAQQVADGADQLADQTPRLVGAIKQAAGGATRLHTAARQVAGGAGQLKTGADQAASGAAELRDGAQLFSGGADQLAAGAKRAASGADRLSSGARTASTAGQRIADGSTDLAAGATELAGALNHGRDQVPTYTAAERQHLRTIAATPIADTLHGFDDIGALVAGPVVVLALWLGALMVLLLLPATTRDPLTWRGPTWKLAIANLRPLLVPTLVQVVVVTAAAEAFLRVGPLRLLALLAVNALITAMFLLVVQALAIGFGTAGRLVAVAVPVIALATVVVSGVPTTLSTTANYLPTYGPVSVVRTLTTHGGAPTADIAFTLGWLAVGVLGVLLATASRRTTRSPLSLDPPSRFRSAAG